MSSDGKDAPREAEDGGESLASATRALTEALGQLSRAVKREAGRRTQETARKAQETGKKALSSSLRKTSEELAAVASSIADASEDARNGRRRGRGKAERTRQDILEAAHHIFAAKGYEGASVADIAAAAGYTKGALYANFPSKEALFLEMARELHRNQKDLLDQHRKAGTEPPLLCDSPAEYSDKELESILIGLEWWTYAVRHEEAREEVGTMWRETLHLTAGIVAQGNGRPEPSPDDISAAFGLVAVHTLANIAAAIIGPEEVRAMAESLIERKA